jgi:hypothetical protein
MSFLDAAFDLCRWGWRVFPLLPGQKIPAIPKSAGGHGCLDATDDEEILGRWAREYPRANIGIACGEPSGIVVIDLDPRNGSHETVAKLAEQKKTFPPTAIVQTANGGRHLYYAYTGALKNSKSVLGKGIDIKTTGGYVVAPPSELDGGKRYRWLVSPLGEHLPPIPRWVIEALRPKPQPTINTSDENAPKNISALIRSVREAPAGQRNNILFWAAMRAAESKLLNRQALASFENAAIFAGLDKTEVKKTLASASQKSGLKW